MTSLFTESVATPGSDIVFWSSALHQVFKLPYRERHSDKRKNVSSPNFLLLSQIHTHYDRNGKFLVLFLTPPVPRRQLSTHQLPSLPLLPRPNPHQP